MLKNLFLIGLIAAIGFLGWRHFTATPPPPTAEQEVAAFVAHTIYSR